MRPHVLHALEHYLRADVANLLAPTWFTCVGIAGLVTLILMVIIARRRGIDSGTIASAVLWCYVAAVAAGILVPMAIDSVESLVTTGHVRLHWAGMTSFWGYLAGGIAVALVCRRDGLSLPRLGDLSVLPMGVALVFARLGCFMAGCDYGKVTSLPWAVRFPAGSPAWRDHLHAGLISGDRADSLPVHPTQLYEAAIGLVIAAVALVMSRRQASSARRHEATSHQPARLSAPRPLADGQLFAIAAAIYAIGRLLVVEPLRGDAGRGIYAGLSSGQIFSLLVLVAIGMRYVVGKRRILTAVAATAVALAVMNVGESDAHAEPFPMPPQVADLEQPVGPPTGQQSPGAGQQSPGAGQQSPGAGQQSPGAGQQSPRAGQQSPGAGQQSPGAGQQPDDPSAPPPPVDAQDPSGPPPYVSTPAMQMQTPNDTALQPEQALAAPNYAERPQFSVGLLLGVASPINRRSQQVGTLMGPSLSVAYLPGRFGVWFDYDNYANSDATHGTFLLSGSFTRRFGPKFAIGARLGIGHTSVNFKDASFRDVSGTALRFDVISEIVLARHWAIWVRPLSIDTLSASELGGPVTTYQFRVGFTYRFGSRRNAVPVPPVGPPEPPPPMYPRLDDRPVASETDADGAGTSNGSGNRASPGARDGSSSGMWDDIDGSANGGASIGGASIGGASIGGASIGGASIGGASIGGASIGGASNGSPKRGVGGTSIDGGSSRGAGGTSSDSKQQQLPRLWP